MALAHRLEEWVVQPRRWPQVTLRPWGMAAPNGAGSQAWEQEIQPSRWSQLTVRWKGMAAPNGAGSQAGGDGESRPGGVRCLTSAYGGYQPPTVRAHRLGGRGVLPRRWSCAHHGGCRWGIGGCYHSRTPSLVWARGWWSGSLIYRTGMGADETLKLQW